MSNYIDRKSENALPELIQCGNLGVILCFVHSNRRGVQAKAVM